MPAYMVYAYYCDECKVKMPVVADEAAGGDAAAFVEYEKERHKKLKH